MSGAVRTLVIIARNDRPAPLRVKTVAGGAENEREGAVEERS